MRAKPDTGEHADVTARRARARRTALLFGGIAVAIYVLFILSGVLAQ